MMFVVMASAMSFNKLLLNIKNNNYSQYLENKIFENEYGCWVKYIQLEKNKYPEKIYKFVNEPIIGFTNVEYYLSGNKVSYIPETKLVLELYNNPSGICTMIIDNNIKYTYHFSNKVAFKERPGLIEALEIDELYKILYHLINK